MKLGFIGIGNMAGAIIKGLIQSGNTPAESIYVTNTTPEKLKTFAQQTGVQTCQTNEELVSKVDIIFFATKPTVFPTLLAELNTVLVQYHPVIVSIAAGIRLDQLASYLEPTQKLPIIRVMPNLNNQIGEGMAAVCGNETATKEQLQSVLEIFNTVGKAIQLPEKDFSAFTAIAGCSPAFAFLFIDFLARAAVKHGLSKAQATEIAAQAVLGSAKMVLESTLSPMDLVDQVSSPGGTTIEGVLSLSEHGFTSSIVKAVDATIEKDHYLS